MLRCLSYANRSAWRQIVPVPQIVPGEPYWVCSVNGQLVGIGSFPGAPAQVHPVTDVLGGGFSTAKAAYGS